MPEKLVEVKDLEISFGFMAHLPYFHLQSPIIIPPKRLICNEKCTKVREKRIKFISYMYPIGILCQFRILCPPARCYDSGSGPCFGKTTVILVPTPGALFRYRAAPWYKAPCFTMDRPKPVPPISRERFLSTR